MLHISYFLSFISPFLYFLRVASGSPKGWTVSIGTTNFPHYRVRQHCPNQWANVHRLFLIDSHCLHCPSLSVVFFLWFWQVSNNVYVQCLCHTNSLTALKFTNLSFLKFLVITYLSLFVNFSWNTVKFSVFFWQWGRGWEGSSFSSVHSKFP